MDFPEAVQRLRRLDGWSNVLSGFGTSRDKRTAGTVAPLQLLDFETLVDLVRGDDMASRICERPAGAMTREWGECQIKDEKDAGEELDQALEDIGAQQAFREALFLEAATGGAGIILGVNGGDFENSDELMLPLDPNEIETIDHLVVFAAKELQAVAYYADPMRPNFGLPAAYRVVPRVPFAVNGETVVGFGAKFLPEAVSGAPTHPWAELPEIHESRILVFPGLVVDRRQRLTNWGHGDSRLQRCWEVMRDFYMTWAATANLLQDFAQATLAIPGLLNMLAQDDGAAILKRAQILDMTRSVARILLLDGGDVGTGAGAEVFKREVTPLSGVPELLEKFMLRLAASADMPVSMLFGQSATGMNATGEGDTRNWYDHIKEHQPARMGQQIRKLGNALMAAKKGPTEGTVYPRWKFRFTPLWQQSEKEQADTRFVMAQTDEKMIAQGVLDPREVRASRFGGDGFQLETQLDEEVSSAFDALEPMEGFNQPEEEPDGGGEDPEKQKAEGPSKKSAKKSKPGGREDTAHTGRRRRR